MTIDKSRSRDMHIGTDLPRLVELFSQRLFFEKERIVQGLLANATDAILLRASAEPNFRLADGRITINTGFATPKHRFSITDNGIGITPEHLELAFRGIASSGKRAEIANAATDTSCSLQDVVGGFGFGLFSALTLGDELEITSRPSTNHPPFRINLTLAGNWTVMEGVDKPECGTTIAISVNERGAFLTKRSQLEDVVRRFCSLVPVPIYLDDDVVPFWPGRRSERGAKEGSDLIHEVSQILARDNLAFQAEPAVGGLRPDFIVYGPSGRSVLLEVKSWNEEPGYISRMLRQLDQYKDATGTSAVLMVLPDTDTNASDEGITTLANLTGAIRNEFEKPTVDTHQKSVSFQSRAVFAAMPFSSEYDDTYFVAMVPAAEELGSVCVRVDKEEFSGDVIIKIQSLIRESAAVIGDLSESRPNVLYELGYAHALGKPVVHISSTPSSSLPFDVRNWNTILYEKGRTHILREALVNRLGSVIT